VRFYPGKHANLASPLAKVSSALAQWSFEKVAEFCVKIKRTQVPMGAVGPLPFGCLPELGPLCKWPLGLFGLSSAQFNRSNYYFSAEE